jgi:hypothetical protein
VVIINLLHRTELDSTFPGVLERFSEELRDHKSKLMLAGISNIAKSVLEDTSHKKESHRI